MRVERATTRAEGSTSITKDLSESTKKARRLRSRVAPRLSAFDTNMYFTPASSSCKARRFKGLIKGKGGKTEGRDEGRKVQRIDR